MNNPYFEEFRKLFGDENNSMSRLFDNRTRLSIASFEVRRSMVVKYAWAVPDNTAISILLKHSPLVEICAGTGYWSKLVQESGGNILPFDISPPGKVKNEFGHRNQWTAVEHADETIVSNYPDRTLFVCWPPMNNTVESALLNYKGNTVIYVGEPNGGCTGWADKLDTDWELSQRYTIPQWDGIHDVLVVYKRKM